MSGLQPQCKEQVHERWLWQSLQRRHSPLKCCSFITKWIYYMFFSLFTGLASPVQFHPFLYTAAHWRGAAGSLVVIPSVCYLCSVHLLCVCVYCTALVTSYLHYSAEFHSILLKVSVIACESGCRSAVPLPCTTRTDSAKGFILSWTTDFTHV